MEDRLLTLFKTRKSLTLKEVEKALKLKSSKDFTQMIKVLNQLEEERCIYTDHNKYYYIDPSCDFIGRAKDISPYELLVSNTDKKLRVRKDKRIKVFDQDEVVVHIDRYGPKIQYILKHNIVNLTGTFYLRKKNLYFHTDIDYHREIKILNKKDFKIYPGHKAVVKIVKYNDPLEVKIIEMLGHENEAGVDISARLYKHHVRQIFSSKVKKEAGQLASQVTKKDKEGRIDLRNLLTVTIDGDDARDFDDAISVEKNKKGYILYVHIADVSHYVKVASAIDQEAYQRATSIYVCDRVVPMLPFELSNGICSLNPNVDRCTITCKMYIDETGNCSAYEIMPTLIHSDMRCTYDKVDRFLNGDAKILSEYHQIKELLTDFELLAKLLQKKSKERGTIEFNTKEAKILLDKKGLPIDIQLKKRGFSSQMIEEAMILANVCVANYLHTHNLPCMYRVHEKPDPKKVESLYAICHALNIPVNFDVEHLDAKDIQSLLENLTDPNTKEVISLVSLRTMQKAKYDARCIGHFGLALDEYCHFTSPIRRYPDLIVHRMLRKYLFEKSIQDPQKDVEKIKMQSLHTSLKERDAIDVEREIDDYKKAQYMHAHIGKKFKGTIVGVMNFGFFVELDNSVEGLVPVHTLYQDYFAYDEVAQTLRGEVTNITYSLGQRVNVICTQADIEKGQVTFALSK